MIKDTYVYLIPRSVKSEEKLVGIAVRTLSNVYILENEEQCYMSQIDESFLWHRRMGHLIFENLVKFSKKGFVMNFRKPCKTTK